jgi:exodeoxyribonuclease V alpha subunit
MVLPVNEQGELSSAGKLKACFWVDGTVKAISAAQMPPHETCYAITVHKSQGSEYRHVTIVLPADVQQAKANVVLSRELVYTAVTRAKEKIDVWAGEGVLEVAAARTTERMSGLLHLLH